MIHGIDESVWMDVMVWYTSTYFNRNQESLRIFSLFFEKVY